MSYFYYTVLVWLCNVLSLTFQYIRVQDITSRTQREKLSVALRRDIAESPNDMNIKEEFWLKLPDSNSHNHLTMLSAGVSE